MDVFDIITPWVGLILVLVPLIGAERWLHQHLFGVGYLLFKDKESATGCYYIIFFPAIALHELIQYFVAGIFNVPIKKLEIRTQAQENGTLRYDFVTIDRKKTDIVRSSIVGGSPFIFAAAIFYFISTQILDLHSVIDAFSSGTIRNVGYAIQDQFNTPDFWIWLYILFAISNGMIPTKEDRDGWGLIIGSVVGMTALFLFLGLDAFLIETYQGPVKDGLELATVSLSIILGIDIVAILLLGITEDSLERMRGFKMDYGGPNTTTKTKEGRVPGSNKPIPKGELMPSIYNIALPIAEPPAKPDAKASQSAAIADVGSGGKPPSA